MIIFIKNVFFYKFAKKNIFFKILIYIFITKYNLKIFNFFFILVFNLSGYFHTY